MSKREENKAIVKARLLTEAQRLFSEKGFDDTTVADIVGACDIGRGTFYNYFNDAKGIFEAVIEKMNTDIQIVLRQAHRDASNFYEKLFFSFKYYFDFVSQPAVNAFFHKNQALIRNSAYSSDAFRKMTRDIMDQMLDYGKIDRFKQKHEYLLLSILIMGGPMELFLNRPYMDMNLSNEEMAKFLSKVFMKIFTN